MNTIKCRPLINNGTKHNVLVISRPNGKRTRFQIRNNRGKITHSFFSRKLALATQIELNNEVIAKRQAQKEARQAKKKAA